MDLFNNEERSDNLYIKQDLAGMNTQPPHRDTNVDMFKFKRKECRSASGESFKVDLEQITRPSFVFTNSLIVPTRSSLDKAHVAPLSGSFGLNPSSFASLKLSSPSRSPPSNFFAKLFVASSKKMKEKRVKRLSHQFHTPILTIDKTSKPNNVKNKLLHAVSLSDYSSVLSLLQSNEVDINSCDDKQRTSLHIASAKGNVEIVRVLLDFSADPNIRDCVYNLPIHLAIISSHVPVVTMLLEAGTDIHSLDMHGKTVLHLAGTRLRWLLNDDNHKASPKLKIEAIQIMNMIKEYLKRKHEATSELDILSNKFENTFSMDDISSLTNELLKKFDNFKL